MNYVYNLEKPYCVFKHVQVGQEIAFKSARLSEAFNFPVRQKTLRRMLSKAPVTVVILGEFASLAEAMEAERQMRFAAHTSKGAIRVEPSGVVYPSVRAASEATGVSQGAISSSCTRRHEWVRGMRFTRLDRP